MKIYYIVDVQDYYREYIVSNGYTTKQKAFEELTKNHLDYQGDLTSFENSHQFYFEIREMLLEIE